VSHSHTCLLVHAAFATKERFAVIPAELFESLWAFTGGMARKNGMKALAIGGTSDHMHVLLSVPATMPVAKALKLIKAGSSKFVNEHLQHRFEWQQGMVHSPSESHKGNHTGPYTQPGEHHRKRKLCGGICRIPGEARISSP
jgi:putative transposase